MRNGLAVVLALVSLAASATTAEAFGHCRKGCGDGCDSGCAPVCAPACAPAPQIQWVEKQVTCYRPVTREKQVTVTVNRIVPREVITPLTRTTMVPETRNVERTVTFCRMVPREVVKQVPVCVMVPTACTDPCTGCTYTVCRPQTVMKEVRCCVMEAVQEQRQITVPVCTYKPVQQTVQCRRIVCDTVPEQVTRTVRYCEMEAYQTTVRVAVCVPAPVCAPACN